MDLELEIRLSKKGNKESFIKLMQYYESSMYRVAKSILQSDNDCADAIQETILSAYKSISFLKQPDYFKTWLIRILINQCNKLLKQKSKVIPMDEFLEQQHAYSNYENIEIQEIVNSLEDELRTIVILYYFEDLPIREISSILEIPEGTVKSRLSRARKRLRILVESDITGGALNG